ncbi:Na+/H+ antiporter NhaC [Peribacillus kribbensis]|uniref:Na+/H+ antiporter NhaC n=1 Tax=Peribacillus kribbensis TaxID=356658 RepID=UPI0004183ADE|nr:Na+/H+ antiporter NhaC [Peribacillus kribbensis]
MFKEPTTLKPSFREAGFILLLIIALISFGVIKGGLAPQIPIAASVVVLLIYGKIKGIGYKVMEKGMIQGASSSLGAVFIFIFIGMLISSWMMSGTIPTLMYYGFNYLPGSSFYASAFLISSLVGLCIGSSFTTSATIGVAFIGMAGAMDISAAVTAGAVVSGAYLGDKMSPLSDTCNLASETVGVNLFEHVRNMLWTTIPGFIISFVVYWLISPAADIGRAKDIHVFLESLQKETHISLFALIPFVLTGILALRKIPAVPVLASGTAAALAVSFFQSKQTLTQACSVLFSGYKLDSGVKQLDSILSRGGIESMMFSISLVLLALAMGGLLFQLGIIPALLEKAAGQLVDSGRLITATVLASIGVNVLIGEQYLSILLPGKTFLDSYIKAGLTGKTLSRALEDGGTVVNALIPWGVSGVFLTQVLGVSTIEYAPYALFCLICPVLSVISGFSGIGISFSRSKAPQKVRA